jgi:hypothetical protein
LLFLITTLLLFPLDCLNAAAPSSEPNILLILTDDRGPGTKPEAAPALVRAAEAVGLAAKAFELLPSMTQDTTALVEKCLCQDGCPACVGPGAGPAARGVAVAALQTGKPVVLDADALTGFAGEADHLARLEQHHTSGSRSGLNYRLVTRLLNALARRSTSSASSP